MVWKKFYKGKKEKQEENKIEEKTNNGEMTNKKQEKIYVMPLGGLGEVGKNMTLFQFKDEIIVLDVGLAFPEEDMLGVDLVIPDFKYAVNNVDKIKAVVLTHGHEDHIGALPYFYKEVPATIPMYGSRLTLGLAKVKFDSENVEKQYNFKEVKSRDKIKIGKYFEIEFIKVTHSIADAFAVAIHTPAGTILHTGDFKVDLTPVDGQPMDFYKLAELGEKGVLLLMSDSTNAEQEGTTMPEKSVGESLKVSFRKAKGRIVIASFASHIHRVQQIIDVSVAVGRKIAVEGRSMKRVVKIASELGYLNIPEDTILDLKNIKSLDDEKVVLLCTGTQGEPLSALSRIASGRHRHIEVRRTDTIIISATPIPGNEKAVYRNINSLLKTQAEVIYEKGAGIHVSGHGNQEDLKLMLNLIKPKYFMPVHGEYKHLKKHKELAMEVGIPEKNIILAEKNGMKIEVSKEEIKITGKVPSGMTLIDGLGIGDVGNIVLRDRQHLSEDGIFIVVLTISGENGKILSGPDLITRGFVYARESGDLIRDTSIEIKESLKESEEKNIKDWMTLKKIIQKTASKYLYEKTGRNPIILPIIMEV
ncbi:MAG: ribonuclease J [Fusobacteriia bacterium 4572_132]|nr:MAG: ribonuclease J [Fusobacteriia bacterium 4572_132]